MKIIIKKQLFLYLLILFFFSIFHLDIKSSVGNDSTISEWFINYTGGFTKRGIIGQISIFFSRLFLTDLRDVIFYFQSITVGVYYPVIHDYNDPLYYNSPIFPCYYRNGQRINLENADWQLGEATGVFID